MGSLWTTKSTLFRKQKNIILKMIKRPYVNKRGRSMLGEEQKKVLKKQKGECFSALLFPLAKAALSIFSSGKKTWQEETE